MSNELRGVSPTGTLYARLMNKLGQVWNTADFAFEAYDAANYADYDLAMAEQGNSSVYVGDFPSSITTAGTYEFYIHRQAGASPAEGDIIINTGKIDWTGSVSIGAATGAQTGSEFRDYVLRLGFKRTDKDAELYEATTDAIQEMRRRFAFDEAQADATTTDIISTAGDFKINLESDLGLLLGVVMEDGNDARPLDKNTKSEFDNRYSDINVTSHRGHPKDYCVYAGQVYIGPIPDAQTYAYRLSYSKRAGTITSSTAGVPFTNLYRDVLADNVLSRLYALMDDFDKSGYYAARFEKGLLEAMRRENYNSGGNFFNVKAVDC